MCERFIVRIDISSAFKKQLKMAFAAFGVNESYLYPDLEHLARDIEAFYKPQP